MWLLLPLLWLGAARVAYASSHSSTSYEPLLTFPLTTSVWLVETSKSGAPVDSDRFEESLQTILPYHYPTSGGIDPSTRAETQSYSDVRFDLNYRIFSSHKEGGGGAAAEDVQRLEKAFLVAYSSFILGQPKDIWGFHVVPVSAVVQFMNEVEAPSKDTITSSVLNLPLLIVADKGGSSGNGGREESGGGMELPPHIIVSDDDAAVLHGGGTPEGSLECIQAVTAKFAFYDDTAMADCSQLVLRREESAQRRRRRLGTLPYETRLLRIVTGAVQTFSAGHLDTPTAAGTNKIFIPIIVFKGSASASEKYGHDGKKIEEGSSSADDVDTAALQAWAEALLLPHQEVEFVTESVTVEDHPSVVLALAAATKYYVATSSADPHHHDDVLPPHVTFSDQYVPGSGSAAIKVPYLDSAILHRELLGSGTGVDGSDDDKSGDVFISRLLHRAGHAHEAMAELALEAYRARVGHGGKHKALKHGSRGTVNPEHQRSETEKVLLQWLEALDDPIGHSADVPASTKTTVDTAATREVLILPVFVFAGMQRLLPPGLDFHSSPSQHHHRNHDSSGSGQAWLQPVWENGELYTVSTAGGTISKDGGSTSPLVLGLLPPPHTQRKGENTGKETHVYSHYLGGYRGRGGGVGEEEEEGWSRVREARDATKTVAAGIARALAGLGLAEQQGMETGSSSSSSSNRGSAAAPLWGHQGGVHPFSATGAFASSSNAGAAAAAASYTDLVLASTARRAIIASRLSHVIHTAYELMEEARSRVRRLVVAMHMLSHSGVAGPMPSLSSSSSSSSSSSQQNQNSGKMAAMSQKSFLESLDLADLEGDESGPGAVYEVFSRYFTANSERLKMRGGHAVDASLNRVATYAKHQAASIKATETALEALANHVLAQEQELHYVRERVGYSTDHVLSSLKELELGSKTGDNVLRNIADDVAALEGFLLERRASLSMISSAIDDHLAGCEMQWDAVDDSGVYNEIQQRRRDDKHWYESRRGSLKGGAVNVAGRGSGTGVRGALQWLLGVFSTHGNEPSLGMAGGTSGRKSLQKSLESAAAASSSSYRGSNGGSAGGSGGNGWALLLVLLLLALTAGAAWLYLVHGQRRAKKIA